MSKRCNDKIKNKNFLKKYLTNKTGGDIITKLSEDSNNQVGVDCGEGPPVPIPNTEVKLACAEDTRREAAGKISRCQHIITVLKGTVFF